MSLVPVAFTDGLGSLYFDGSNNIDIPLYDLSAWRNEK